MQGFKLYTLLLLFIFSSCDTINPEEEIPAYLEILPFTYTSSDGSTSQQITDGWIYVGGEYLGAFDLPKTIPVLMSGNQDIIIDPGIKENGINSFPNIYPFYKRFSGSIDLVPGETVSIQPDTRYDDDFIHIIFNEDFNGSEFNRFDEEDIVNDDNDVKEGTRSGLIQLDATTKPTVSLRGEALNVFPTQGDIGYLEMDYKSELTIFVGVIGFDATGNQTFSEFTYGLKPKEEWNKVYFNYTELFSLLRQQNTVSYQIQIGMQIPIENGEFIMENAEVHLDNIKLITF
ncbi:MAG: hypothetical protein ACI8P3_003182 [Saprospiraceae bacterium]|jgi:hypothetical protein